jgi:hypothetical protein
LKKKTYSADAKLFFKDDNDTLEMINEVFIVGSSWYTMSIQMLVAKATLQDRDQYARILPNNVNGAKNFKQNHTVKDLKRFLRLLYQTVGDRPHQNLSLRNCLPSLSLVTMKDPTLLSNVRIKWRHLRQSRNWEEKVI